MNPLIKTDEQRTAVDQRRLNYMEQLNSIYADGYGEWLARQPSAVKQRIQKKTSHIRHGLSANAVLNCRGPSKCPFFAACPIPEAYPNVGPLEFYPIGEACVLEAEYMAQQTVDYIQNLDIDPSDSVEMSLVHELALLDVLRNRAVLILSHGDKRGHGRDLLTIDESIVGFDREGRALTSSSTKIHPVVQVMEMHEKRRLKILEKLNATRDTKVRLYGGSLEGNDKLFEDMQAIKQYLETITKQPLTLSQEEDRMKPSQEMLPLHLYNDLEQIK